MPASRFDRRCALEGRDSVDGLIASRPLVNLSFRSDTLLFSVSFRSDNPSFNSDTLSFPDSFRLDTLSLSDSFRSDNLSFHSDTLPKTFRSDTLCLLVVMVGCDGSVFWCGTYWIVAGTNAGLVMGAVVSLVETSAAGGCRIGPDSIQLRISATDEKCSSPVEVWVYVRV